MTARIPVGDVVYVTDTAGTTFRGELGPPTDDAVRVKVRSQMHEIPAAEVRRVRWQQPDSLFTGVAIGAAIGAVPGLYYLAVDPNECRGMCPEEYTLIVIGAVVGGVIDRAITRKVTVYSAEPAIGARRVTIGPLLMRARTGVQLAVSF